MISWFRKRRIHSPHPTQQLATKLDQLESSVKELLNRSSEVHIHIHQLDIHQPVLEQLTFRLDQLDIDELSGSLNIGNNLGIQASKKSVSKHSQPSDPSSTDPLSEMKVSSNQSGFSIRYPNKPVD
ncbi:hypothetical protein SAMN04487866_10834 [Thermoactinomyces sp. DSM 45891]|uniref:hypothetical protein n=1 Tax=Thermoactinomyces sp. DSM 45891 TaxID=1761907 RepID=UPI00091413A0|nr:hypothetical protein [Thermoactinomyces sp. DSM 45891]SFX44717.1 hypothetical protein SAMN04487866_10834 [Thermoactinomyces sp. DSM 45891]